MIRRAARCLAAAVVCAPIALACEPAESPSNALGDAGAASSAVPTAVSPWASSSAFAFPAPPPTPLAIHAPPDSSAAAYGSSATHDRADAGATPAAPTDGLRFWIDATPSFNGDPCCTPPATDVERQAAPRWRKCFDRFPASVVMRLHLVAKTNRDGKGAKVTATKMEAAPPAVVACLSDATAKIELTTPVMARIEIEIEYKKPAPP